MLGWDSSLIADILDDELDAADSETVTTEPVSGRRRLDNRYHDVTSFRCGRIGA